MLVSLAFSSLGILSFLCPAGIVCMRSGNSASKAFHVFFGPLNLSQVDSANMGFIVTQACDARSPDPSV